MDNKLKYQRSFLIFDEEDNGYGTEQKPSGHVKIEIREGKGKLFCQVSNLSEDNGKIQYQLFLIKSDHHQVVPVLVGNIELKKNRGDVEWVFDPYDINKTKLVFDEFNVIAVLANYTDRKNNYSICPLVAYKDGKVEWRQKLNNILQEEKSKEEPLKQFSKVDDISINVIDNKHEIANKKQEGTKADNPIEEQQSEANNEEITAEINNLLDKQKPDEEKDKVKGENEAELDGEKPLELLEKNEISDESKPLEEKPVEEELLKEKQINEKTIKVNDKSYSSYDGSKLFDMYTDDGKENINLNTNCINCIFLNNKNSNKPEVKEFGYEELTKQFDLTFEKYVPFSVKRTDYNWWKVTSPIHLNNILYKFGIKIPVLFNPLVLMAHYKYNHLIVGVYQDDIRQKDYIVCGIPGVYWVDEKPFGNACRWAQVEGNTPAYGAFGYWIVYINPKTGKILAIEE